MIGYVTLGTNNIAESTGFYESLFTDFGVTKKFATDTMCVWSSADDKPFLMITQPYDGEPATVGNGVMISLTQENSATVDALHARAMTLGAKDEGEPGDRGSGYYCAYIRDLDGNKINFFCQQ